MRFIVRFCCFLGVIIGVLALGCGSDKAAEGAGSGAKLRGDFIPEPDLSELIIELNSNMEAAYNRGDMEAVAAFYAEQAIILGPEGYQIEGLPQIRNYWTRIKAPLSWKLSVAAFSRNEQDLYKTDAYKKLANKPPDWKEAVGDRLDGKNVIYQFGHSSLQYKDEDGKTVTGDVDYILLWVQQPEGAYKIEVDSYTVN